MPMHKYPIGKDDDGKEVVMVWGADLNWAHGYIEMHGQKEKEYYRTHGRGNAYYAVARDLEKHYDAKGHVVFNYWYVSMHIDGKTTQLPTEFMSAYEGQEVCQIFESERDARIHKEERARIEGEKNEET